MDRSNVSFLPNLFVAMEIDKDPARGDAMMSALIFLHTLLMLTQRLESSGSGLLSVV